MMDPELHSKSCISFSEAKGDHNVLNQKEKFEEELRLMTELNHQQQTFTAIVYNSILKKP